MSDPKTLGSSAAGSTSRVSQPSSREPVRGPFTRKRPMVSGRTHCPVGPDARAEPDGREPRQVHPGREHPRVPSHASHRHSVLVVQVARNGTAAPHSARNDPPLEGGGRSVHGLRHAKGAEHLAPGELVEWQPGHLFEHQAEEERVEIAVLRAVSRDANQGLRVQQIDGPRPAPTRLQIEGDVALEAARVVEQHAHGDLVLGAAGEAGQIPADRRLEVELSLIHEAERRSRRCSRPW